MSEIKFTGAYWSMKPRPSDDTSTATIDLDEMNTRKLHMLLAEGAITKGTIIDLVVRTDESL